MNNEYIHIHTRARACTHTQTYILNISLISQGLFCAKIVILNPLNLIVHSNLCINGFYKYTPFFLIGESLALSLAI